MWFAGTCSAFSEYSVQSVERLTGVTNLHEANRSTYKIEEKMLETWNLRLKFRRVFFLNLQEKNRWPETSQLWKLVRQNLSDFLCQQFFTENPEEQKPYKETLYKLLLMSSRTTLTEKASREKQTQKRSWMIIFKGFNVSNTVYFLLRLIVMASFTFEWCQNQKITFSDLFFC